MTSVGMTAEQLASAVAAAKAKIAARSLPKTFGQLKVENTQRPIGSGSSVRFEWNSAQQRAIDLGLSGKSFCLIGSAGTGKTTTLKGLLSAVLRSGKLPVLEKGTKHLQQGAPGVVLFSYTRRAVRNIAKQMPSELARHCITGHKLLEFAPEVFEVDDGKGGVRKSMRFLPSRHRFNKLPNNLRLVIIDESSMVAADFFDLVLDALPGRGADVQFIFLGDLHQLPPVYGDAILGHKLLELPIVELTEVYRQALESPIIDIALQIKDGAIRPEYKVITTKTVVDTKRGKVTLHPWKQKLDLEEGCFAMQRFLRSWIRDGHRPGEQGDLSDPLDFENDVILCSWNKSFGNIELNKAIGTELALKFDREVYEVIAGYSKLYFSIGDRVLHEKRDAIITRIVRNPRYVGKQPQYQNKSMDYWGYTKQPVVEGFRTDEDIELMLDASMDFTDVEDRTHEASHILYLRYVDDTRTEEEAPEETLLSSSGDLNLMELAYCMSVHKSQGSEWKRVIFITHGCHQKMLSRELVYTAITRASQELYIFMEPMMLTRSSQQARIKGITLEDKLKFFTLRAKEHAQKQLLNEEDEEDGQ